MPCQTFQKRMKRLNSFTEEEQHAEEENSSFIKYKHDVVEDQNFSFPTELQDKKDKFIPSMSVDDLTKLQKSTKQTNYLSRREKVVTMIRNIILTLGYVAIFVVFGFTASIGGPTLQYIIENTQIEQKDSGLIFTLRGIGSIVSSLFAGKIVDFLHKKSSFFSHGLLALSLIVLATTTALVPFVPYYSIILALFCLYGVASSFVNVECNFLVASIWKEKVTPFLLFLHCSFGIGASLGPFVLTLMRRFSMNDFIFGYGLAGVLNVISAIFLMFLQIVTYYLTRFISRSRTATEQMMDPTLLDENSAASANLTQKKVLEKMNEQSSSTFVAILKNYALVFATGVALFFQAAFETCLGSYYPTYLDLYLQVDRKTIPALVSAYFFSFTTGRFIAGVISSVVSPLIILAYTCMGSIIGVACFAFIAPGSPTVLIWIATIFTGLSVAAGFPTIFALPASSFKGLQLSAGMTSLLVVESNLGGTITPYVMSNLLNSLGFLTFFPQLLILQSCTGVCFIVLSIYAVNRQQQFEKEERMKKERLQALMNELEKEVELVDQQTVE